MSEEDSGALGCGGGFIITGGGPGAPPGPIGGGGPGGGGGTPPANPVGAKTSLSSSLPRSSKLRSQSLSSREAEDSLMASHCNSDSDFFISGGGGGGVGPPGLPSPPVSL